MEVEAIAQALATIERAIAEVCARTGRETDTVKIVAAAKKQSVECIASYLTLCSRMGRAPIVGENYVQEFKQKREALTAPFSAHLIGPLQRNKARDAVRLFDVIQSVHSESIAEALNLEAGKAGKVQEIFLQVNISADPAKSGFLPDGAERFFSDRLPSFRNLHCTGLMTITELHPTAEAARPDFRALRELAQRIDPALKLSMGMSQDYLVAIEEGATHVRIGTALFGPRFHS